MEMSKPDSLFRPTWAVAIIILIGRALIIPFSGIMPQDAYYYLYSRHLSLSYFDHPAGVALILKAVTAVLGNSPAAIKYCAFLTVLFTLYVGYRLAVKFISRQEALIFVAVLSCTPLVGILSWIVTPDVPLMLCWALSVLFIYKADREESMVWWGFAGFFTGLAFDSKYTALFILPGLFLYLMASPDRWRRIFSGNILVYALAFAITVLPVFIWNAQHDWVSISFQTIQRAQGSGVSFKPQFPMLVLLIQVLLLLPWLFYYFLRSFRSYRKDNSHYFLLCFSAPMFIFFMVISLFYWVKINWMMPAFITGGLLAFRYMSARQVKWHMITAVVFFMLASFEMIWYPVPVKSHDTWWGWKDVADQAAQLKKDTHADFVFATDDYKTSAILRVYMQEMVYARNIIGEPALEFDYLGEDIGILHGRNALYVSNIKTLKETDVSEKLDDIRRHFSGVTLIRTQVLVNKFGKVSRLVKYYYCTGYKGVEER